VRYWLFKSEPDAFSIHDLERVGTEPWDGIRNYQARNLLRDEVGVGDLILFHHSNAKPPGVAGLAEVASEPYPDPTAFDPSAKYFDPKSDPDDPRWFLVEVRYVETFERVVPLDELRRHPALADMVLLQRSRLSIQPVTAGQFAVICDLGRSPAPGA
jgi:predicted RNA-binding protein with PUA-like domain